MNVLQTAARTVQITSSMPVLTPIYTFDDLELTPEAPIVAGKS